ncbi:EamA family transporter RarD [Thalassotalea ponticola]|uniref:EamA family transporter RarD n=1 Tax=Thalassotalea ponticola TaxID=1523392 RepID=UPI0025B2FA1C|nr:EamA family transporter RarD [Thalassotalea ponticola]MDN3652785.1 EamA family transporter RarD [Thalassotalea ponticola]
MQQNTDTKVGIINALCAYTIWGLAPIYFKLLTHIDASEILVHRMVWSLVLLLTIVLGLGHWHKVKSIFRSTKTLLMLGCTSLILATNWLIFIWSVTNDHILEASLGYYINPLFSVALAMLFLGERLSKWQIVAVVLALLGVLIQVISLGTVPIIAISLATTFGLYGLLRKKMAVDSFPGLTIEAAWMFPLAVLYWTFFIDSPSSNMFENTFQINMLLVLSGLITTAPLLFFTAAAKRLPLTTMGFFQYLGPSIMFLLAVFIFDEPIVGEKLLTFAFIWAALAIYTTDSLVKHKKRRQLAKKQRS